MRFLCIQEQLDGLFKGGGSPPWTTAASALEAKQVYHGRLYNKAAADVARCTEESAGFLPVEKRRLVRTLTHAVAQVAAAIERHEGGVGDPAARGKAFLLRKHLVQLEAMRVEADTLLQRIPPPRVEGGPGRAADGAVQVGA